LRKPLVPSWFSKALVVIDPTYRVEKPEDGIGFFIIKDIDLTLKADDGRSLSIPGKDIDSVRARGSLPVLWVETLSEDTLEKLRAMKFRGLELGIFDNPVNELAYYQKLRRDAKKKKEELAVDMISEGLMEAHRLNRKKSWSYGGNEQPKEN
jgi:hypothetical protein